MGTLEVDKSLKAAFKETLEPHGFKKVKGEVSALCEDGNSRDYSSHQLSAGAGSVAAVGGKTV